MGGRFIPKSLVIARYFDADKKSIEKLEAARDDLGRQMEEMEEENSGEEGLLEESKNEKGKLNRAGIANRLKKIEDDSESKEEIALLKKYLELIDEQGKLNRKINEEETVLEKKVLAKYKALSLDEIKVLVVDDKWLARIEQDVQGEMQRISQRLTGRIKELAERYDEALPKLEDDVEKMEKKVRVHLGKMGFKV
jgi:type I restriction enzyme M protein